MKLLRLQRKKTIQEFIIMTQHFCFKNLLERFVLGSLDVLSGFTLFPTESCFSDIHVPLWMNL